VRSRERAEREETDLGIFLTPHSVSQHPEKRREDEEKVRRREKRDYREEGEK